MAWPSTRFEALYEAHVKRKAVESIEKVKYAMISGVWANTNLDDEKAGENKRQRLLEEIEDNYNTALKDLYNADKERKVESEIDWSDPFFAAMKGPANPNEPATPDQATPVPDRTTTTDLAEAEFDQA